MIQATFLVVLLFVIIVWTVAPKLAAFIHNYGEKQKKTYEESLNKDESIDHKEGNDNYDKVHKSNTSIHKE